MEDTLPRSATQFLEALKKRRLVLALAGGVTAAAALLPAAVMADDSTATQAAGVAADTAWVIVTGCLVMFMQAGFAMVETGLCRAKNAAHTMSMNMLIYPLGCLGFWAYGVAVLVIGGGFLRAARAVVAWGDGGKLDNRALASGVAAIVAAIAALIAALFIA